MAKQAFTIDADGVGERVDVYLATRCEASRSLIRRHIDVGAVRVDGSRIKPKRTLRAGEVVTWDPPPPTPDEAIAEAIPLEILFEDEHLIVVNKAAGMVVHPAAGHPAGTLVNALLHHCGKLSSVGGRQRPGIVHRLDKDTSGVMLASKTDRAHHHLAEQFQTHSLERRYLALCVGIPPASMGSFDTWHGRHPIHRKRFTTRLERGKRAVTHYRVLATKQGLSLVSARLETGRTHQVRVHLAEHGAPLLGDPVYGRAPKDPLLKKLGKDLGRQALHAALLGIDHPVNGERLQWETDLPEDMAAARDAVALTD